jgi:hypothetical protein
MTQPYAEPYGQGGKFFGLQTIPRDNYIAVVKELNHLGYRVATHAVGDAAMDLVLDAYEAANSEKPIADRRWSLEHGFMPRADQLPRIKKLGVLVSAQDHLYLAAPSLKKHSKTARPSSRSDWRRAGGLPMLAFMNLRSKAVSAVLAAGLFPCTISAGAGPATRPVIVELYTSQGCASCVPADALLAKLTKRPDVIPMSLSVTYWDMLGWKDTYATDANTQRQKSYARAMNRSGIYTPQMIIDGKLDVVGNQRDRVLAALMSSRAGEDADIPIFIGTASGRVEIAIPASKSKSKALATIWVMRTLAQGAVCAVQLRLVGWHEALEVPLDVQHTYFC